MNILSILTTGNISQGVIDGFATGAVSVQEISLIAIVIGAIFVNNVVLSQFLGICPFLGVTPSVGHIPKMSTKVGFSLRIPLVIS